MSRRSWKLEIGKFEKSYDGLFQNFTFCKWASPKMQQIIKRRALLDNFSRPPTLLLWNFLILQSKQPFLGHFSIFWKNLVMCYLPDQLFDWTRNAWCKSPEKKRNDPEMAILTKKSKIFIKAKLAVSKSYIWGLVYFMISYI